MKEFIIFVCTDSTEIFFSKLRSAGLNYNLPSLFTDSFCAGVSNKHCLLTFFMIYKLFELNRKNLASEEYYFHRNVMTFCLPKNQFIVAVNASIHNDIRYQQDTIAIIILNIVSI